MLPVIDVVSEPPHRARTRSSSCRRTRRRRYLRGALVLRTPRQTGHAARACRSTGCSPRSPRRCARLRDRASCCRAPGTMAPRGCRRDPRGRRHRVRAQDPATAQFDEMPRSAIAAAGSWRYVLPPAQLGLELGAISKLPARDAEAPGLERILELLREATGIDFSSYKRTTIERRLERRLAKHHLRHARRVRRVSRRTSRGGAHRVRGPARPRHRVLSRWPRSSRSSSRSSRPRAICRCACGSPVARRARRVYSLAMLLVERFWRSPAGPALRERSQRAR